MYIQIGSGVTCSLQVPPQILNKLDTEILFKKLVEA
jgi:hypothetical protein